MGKATGSTWQPDVVDGCEVLLYGLWRNLQVLTLFDVYDKGVVGTFIARSITGAYIKNTIAQAIDFRKTDGEGLINRNDHVCQFPSKTIRDYLSDLQVE